MNVISLSHRIIHMTGSSARICGLSNAQSRRQHISDRKQVRTQITIPVVLKDARVVALEVGTSYSASRG